MRAKAFLTVLLIAGMSFLPAAAQRRGISKGAWNYGLFADIPSSPIEGELYIVTDAPSNSDCTAGSGSALAFCRYDGVSTWEALGASALVGTGDVTGPSSSTDNTISRFAGTTGKSIDAATSNSPTISDTGAVEIPSTLDVDGAATFKAGPLYDVKAYGALCDATTDDTTAIQAAIDAAEAAGTGIVFFSGPDLCRATSQLTVDSGGIELRGATSQDNAADTQLTSGILADHVGVGLEVDANGVKLSDMVISGNSKTATALLLSNARLAVLERINVQLSNGDGVYVEPTSSASGSPNANDITVQDCQFVSNFDAGYEIADSTDSDINLTRFIRVRASSNGRGLVIRGSNHIVIGGNFSDNIVGPGIVLGSTGDVNATTANGLILMPWLQTNTGSNIDLGSADDYEIVFREGTITSSSVACNANSNVIRTPNGIQYQCIADGDAKWEFRNYDPGATSTSETAQIHLVPARGLTNNGVLLSAKRTLNYGTSAAVGAELRVSTANSIAGGAASDNLQTEQMRVSSVSGVTALKLGAPTLGQTLYFPLQLGPLSAAAPAQITTKPGGASDQAATIGSTTLGQTVSWNLAVDDPAGVSPRDTRAQFFLTDSTQDAGAWGHWMNYDTSGSQPYVIGFGSDTLFKISPGTPVYTFGDGDDDNITFTFDRASTDINFGFENSSVSFLIGNDGIDGKLKLYSEQGGTDYFTLFQPGTQTQDITYTLPVNDGDATFVLQTDGAGALSWVAPSAASFTTISGDYGDEVITTDLDVSGGKFEPPSGTFSNRATAYPTPDDGDMYLVTDAPDASTCTAGGATTRALCVYNSTTAGWVSAGGAGSVTVAFKTISTPAGTSPVADNATDTLNFLAGQGINITGSDTFGVDIVTIGNAFGINIDKSEMADSDHGDVAWSSTNATVEDVHCTGSCISNGEVDDNITASNYLPLGGGVMTGQLDLDNLGLEFEESATLPSCTAGFYGLYANSSTGKIKKCENGAETDIGAAGAYLLNVVEDTTPQLGGNLDVQTFGLTDTAGNEYLTFSSTGSAINQLTLANSAAGSGPTLSSSGGDADVDMNFTPKGAGEINMNGPVNFNPSATPGVDFSDTDDADSGINSAIDVDLSDATSGNQDADVTWSAEVADAAVTFLEFDADDTVDTQFNLGKGITGDIQVGGAAVGFVEVVTASTGDGELTVPADSIGPAEIDSTTGAYDFGGVTSLEVPNGTGPTVNAAGEIAIDSDGVASEMTQGFITYYDGTQQMYALALDVTPTSVEDNYIPKYDAALDKWVLEADVGAAGSTWTMAGDTGSESVAGGDTATFTGGVGITTAVTATDTNTITFTPAEVTTPITWADGASASVVWNWNLTAGDPQITFGNGIVNVTSGDIQVGGTSIVVENETNKVGSTLITDGAVAYVDVNATDTLTTAARGANAVWFGTTGLIFEGATNDAVEGLLVAADPTSSDKTWTLPDETGTLLTSATTTGAFTAITGNTLTLGSGTFTALTVDAGATDPVLTFGSDSITVTGAATVDFPDNSISPDDLTTEVRSINWGAGAMSADGTDCTDATEGVLVTSGAPMWSIACPMTSSETDGYVYGNTILSDSYNNGTTPTFEITVELSTDAGASTIHGAIAVQCFTAQETLDTSWTEVQLDITEDVADVTDDILQATSSGSLTGESCAGGDLLVWRFTVCDTDATPSANCTSNAGVENDFNIVGMKMEYTSDVGD